MQPRQLHVQKSLGCFIFKHPGLSKCVFSRHIQLITKVGEIKIQQDPRLLVQTGEVFLHAVEITSCTVSHSVTLMSQRFKPAQACSSFTVDSTCM